MAEILIVSLLAGVATVAGGLLACLVPGKEVGTAFFLSQAAGIMLTVAFFELWPGALASGGISVAWSGLLAGVLLLIALDALFSAGGRRRPAQGFGGRRLLQTGALVAVGIALHDLPEGMAIAAGFGMAEQLGLTVALAIGLHNLPEGLAVAVPLLSAGKRPIFVLFLLCIISLCTPLGALLGYLLMSLLRGWLGGLLAAAAGAMLYISLKELLPQALMLGKKPAFFGLLSGFILAMLLLLLQA